MKKVLISCFVIGMLLFSVGCGNKMSKYESTMKEYATTFYNLHKKGEEGITSFDVSITQLKTAIEVIGDSYDLEKLKNCTDDSYVTLKIDEATKDVKDVEYHLNCEK